MQKMKRDFCVAENKATITSSNFFIVIKIVFGVYWLLMSG